MKFLAIYCYAITVIIVAVTGCCSSCVERSTMTPFGGRVTTPCSQPVTLFSSTCGSVSADSLWAGFQSCQTYDVLIQEPLLGYRPPGAYLDGIHSGRFGCGLRASCCSNNTTCRKNCDPCCFNRCGSPKTKDRPVVSLDPDRRSRAAEDEGLRDGDQVQPSDHASSDHASSDHASSGHASSDPASSDDPPVDDRALGQREGLIQPEEGPTTRSDNSPPVEPAETYGGRVVGPAEPNDAESERPPLPRNVVPPTNAKTTSAASISTKCACQQS